MLAIGVLIRQSGSLATKRACLLNANKFHFSASLTLAERSYSDPDGISTLCLLPNLCRARQPNGLDRSRTKQPNERDTESEAASQRNLKGSLAKLAIYVRFPT